MLAMQIVNNTDIVPPNNSLKLARAIKKAINEYDTKIWKKRSSECRIRKCINTILLIFLCYTTIY